MADFQEISEADLAPAGFKEIGDTDLATAAPSAAPPEPRSFLARAKDSIVSGAGAIKDVTKTLAHQAGQRMAGAFGLEHEAPPTKEQGAAQIRELTRGVDDIVTLGHGQRLAARIGNALGDTPETTLDETRHFSPDPAQGNIGGVSERRERDAELAPQFRTAGEMFGTVLPNPLGEAAGVLGKVAGASAARFAPEAAAAVSKFAGHVPAPVLGAAKGVASYETQAPAAAALSADAEGHRAGAAKEAAMDPAGLVLSMATGAAPAVIEGSGRVVKSYLDKAPAAEAEQLMTGVMAGEGKHGRATTKAAKMLTPKQDAAVEVLRSDRELRDASAKPAKEALPIFHEKLDEIGSQLDPHYNTVDKATGGTSMHNLVTFLDDVTAQLKKEPLNEKYVEAVQGIKRSALTAWAPEMEQELAARQRLQDMGLQAHKEIPDVQVPTKDVRKMVTRLQKRGTEVINALNPGESSQMKADMAGMMKDFIDGHLDAAAEKSPEVAHAVDQIRALNRQYSATAAMTTAIEQRQWGEATGRESGKSLLGNAVNHAALAAAGGMALHGNIPGAVGVVAAPALGASLHALKQGAVSTASRMTRAPGYQASVERLARLARSVRDVSDFVGQAVRAGMGPADARRIWQAAHSAKPPAVNPAVAPPHQDITL